MGGQSRLDGDLADPQFLFSVYDRYRQSGASSSQLSKHLAQAEQLIWRLPDDPIQHHLRFGLAGVFGQAHVRGKQKWEPQVAGKRGRQGEWLPQREAIGQV